MFRQGKKPAFTVSFSRQEDLVLAILEAEYFLDRVKFKRKNEVGTFRFPFVPTSGELRGDKRQVHVQLVARISPKGKKLIDVYAHTEPDDKAIVLHTLSAFLDGACFQAGARMLKRQLKEVGFRVP